LHAAGLRREQKLGQKRVLAMAVQKMRMRMVALGWSAWRDFAAKAQLAVAEGRLEDGLRQIQGENTAAGIARVKRARAMVLRWGNRLVASVIVAWAEVARDAVVRKQLEAAKTQMDERTILLVMRRLTMRSLGVSVNAWREHVMRSKTATVLDLAAAESAELEEMNGMQRHELEKLRSENAELESGNAELESVLTELVEENDTMRAQCETLEVAQQRLDARAGEAEAEVVELRGRVAERDRASVVAAAQMKVEVEGLQSTIAELVARLEGATAREEAASLDTMKLRHEVMELAQGLRERALVTDAASRGGEYES
jgi:myosin heavy subunit